MRYFLIKLNEKFRFHIMQNAHKIISESANIVQISVCKKKNCDKKVYIIGRKKVEIEL
jgi:hypothetical protein